MVKRKFRWYVKSGMLGFLSPIPLIVANYSHGPVQAVLVTYGVLWAAFSAISFVGGCIVMPDKGENVFFKEDIPYDVLVRDNTLLTNLLDKAQQDNLKLLSAFDAEILPAMDPAA